ncbi:hypothetical protein C8Q78DRAFT_1027674, partial [Trametes maxima]
MDTSTNVRFPQEICDKFIDCSRGDMDTLRQCALTCRSWFVRSRYHLYRTAVLGQHSQLSKFVRILRSKPSPDIPTLVEELVLALEPETPTTFVDSACVILARRLPRLHRITLVRQRMSYPSTQPAVRLSIRTTCCIATFATVTRVAFVDLVLASFNEVIRVITGLPNLSVLECRRLQIERLGVISVASRMDPEDSGWLNLRTLVVTGPWDQFLGLSMLFGAVNGNMLEHLSVDSYAGANDVVHDTTPFLRQWSALETLTIEHHYSPSWPNATDDMQMTVETILGEIPCSLRTVCIDFTHSINIDDQHILSIARITSRSLDELFLRMNLRMTAVEVCVTDRVDRASWWREELKDALPRLYERGILNVVVDPPRTYID